MLAHQHLRRNLATQSIRPSSSIAVLSIRHIHSASPQDVALPHTSTASPLSDRPVRLRFAPSPTGHLHLGGLRTALFNHLLARKWGGKWILRIEDTDRARFVPGSVETLVKTLEWAGLDFDEGPGRGESVGPYVQSERLDLYHQHIQTLLDQDKAYRCFCTPSKLAEIQQSQLKLRQTSSYNGTCRHLTEAEAVRRKKAGEKFVVRFKSERKRQPVPEDLIFGSVSDLSGQRRTPTFVEPSVLYSTSELSSPLLTSDKISNTSENKAQGHIFGAGDDIDDFILLKSDGFPTYHFASVVDDFEMNISHVLRGEEWLPSTTKHIQLYHALGWQPPKFGHLPLLVNPNGTKLSKRSGDVQVEDYVKRGYEPEALLNFLALMGWDHLNSTSHNPTTVPFFPTEDYSNPIMDGNSSTELFNMTGLIEAFDLKYITRRRAIVNFDKLDWVNRMHLRRELMLPGEKGKDGLVKRFKGLLEEMTVLTGNPLIEEDAYVGKVLDAELSRVKTLSELPKHAIHYFLPPRYENPEAKKLLASVPAKDYVRAVEAVLTELEAQDEQAPWDYDSIWEVIHKVIADLGYKRKPQLITPLRHAITGRTSGASLPSTMSIVGRGTSIERLRSALDYVGHVRQLPAKASKLDEAVSSSASTPTAEDKNVIKELEDRGFVQALTSPLIADAASNGACVYSGVDPSANSLHLGNLLPLLVLLHFQLAGNKVLAVIGGATGSIGDPSGRSTERNALSREDLDRNVSAIHNQVRVFFDRGLAYAKRRTPDNGRILGEKRILNNLDWTQDVTLLDFLRGVGKHTRVNTMLARDSVKNRLASESGISFTEFTYQLLQAFDFRQLHYDHRCQIQVGGSDQWGNIVAGIDLIKRSKAASAAAAGLPEPPADDPAFGLTIPLLTTSSGEKFGKSAGNALWLDPTLTSVTTFYQYFFRSADADVEKYLKLFTMLPLQEITTIMQRHNLDPPKREAQRLLADEVTQLVHGTGNLAKAQTAMKVLFDSDISSLSAEAVEAAFEGDPRLFIAPRAELLDVALPRLIASAKHARSKSEAARLINGGGVSLNGIKVENATAKLLQSDLHQNKFAVLRIGKASHLIIYATD